MDAMESGLNAAEHDEARRLWPLLLLFWLGNLAATMAQVYWIQRLAGSPPGLADLVRWVMPGYLLWLAAMPVIAFVLTRRFRLEEGRWRVSIAIHLLASLTLAGAMLLVDTMVVLRGRPQGRFVATYLDFARGWLLWVLFTYWFFLAFLLAIRHYRTASARTLQASRLEAELANARLAALRGQLHPHFLFNALNSVSTLVADDPRAAQKMITQLGELLRATLSEVGGADCTLRRELEILRRYTAIEEVRFGERLRVRVECTPDALDARVPPLLLQPLVENAVLHGIQPSLRGGTVHVAARREGRWLRVEVTDDGVGLPAARAERIGLTNTRERLQKRFGGEHAFSIARREPAGTRVRIRIPWSVAPVEEEAHAVAV